MAWYGSTTKQVGTSKVTVRQLKFNSDKVVVQRVCNIVKSARAWLVVTLPEVRTNPSPGTEGDFRLCFNGASNAGFLTVRAVLQNVLANLDKDLSLKVGNFVDSENALGYASAYFSGRRERVGGQIFYEDHDPAKTRISRYGDIHLDKRHVLNQPVKATITLIHEATHKFSNTDDHGARGYFNNDGTRFRARGLTYREALNNADSYAWFVYKTVTSKFKQVIVT